MSSQFVIQSRIASFIASFSVALPSSMGCTVAPSICMRATFGACRATSVAPMYTSQGIPKSAATVAVATPCMPAPVSAMRRFLPIRRASRACPIVLFTLCAPVWLRSSRFSTMRAPPRCSERRRAYVRGDSRPT